MKAVWVLTQFTGAGRLPGQDLDPKVSATLTPQHLCNTGTVALLAWLRAQKPPLLP